MQDHPSKQSLGRVRTLVAETKHQLRLVDVFRQLVSRPVVAVGTHRSVQLQGVSVETVRTHITHTHRW